MILYTADLHFGHANVIRFDHRPFLDVGEMDTTLIKLWNDRVQKDDEVYIVGDFCYRSAKEPEWYLRQLKGKKHLIIGNHDGVILNNEKALSYFETVDKMTEISDEGRRIILCHYPLAEWDAFYRGSYHIYGHIHNKKEDTFQLMSMVKNAYNAGCMINNYSPVSFNELVRNNQYFREQT